MVSTAKAINPLAQTFYAEEGVYLTKIGLFFSQVSSTAPVSIELRPAEQGAPNVIEMIPGSFVSKTASEMSGKASVDASVETIFEFDEPIWLEGGRQYAFCIKSPAKQEYFLWSSQVGDFNLGTTQSRVTKNPEKTVMFRSQSGLLYTPEKDQDLMYILYRAEFKANQATVVLKGAQPQDVLLSKDPLSGLAGSNEITVYYPFHGFLPNDRINLSGFVDQRSYNGVKGSSLKGSRIVTAVDGYNLTFDADSDCDSDISFGGQFLRASKQLKFNTVQLQVADFKPGSTVVNYSGDFTTSKSLAGTESPYARTENIRLTNNVDKTLPSVHGAFTDSNETLLLTGYDESVIVRATLRSAGGQGKQAPYIDMQRCQLLTIQNLIDKQDSSATSGYNVPVNFVPETEPNGGSALAKHITKPVTLAQAATGLKVLYAANMPKEASVDLYYRTTLNGSDSDILEKSFTLATVDNNPPTDEDPGKFREYRYTIGGTFATSLREFNQYQLKLVMNSTNSSKIPRITDLRTIALAADQAF